MANNYVVFIEGIDSLKDFSHLGDDVKGAIAKSVNKATRDGRVRASRWIREQVNFPARYLSPGGKRVVVTRKATRSMPEGVITVRSRPTSLARFVIGNPKRGEPLRLEVAPGRSRYLKRAFLVKLPQGTAPVDTKFNLGLAIRLRPGETLRNKVEARKLTKGLYLLYGPSIDQVFLNNSGNGVAKDMEPFVLDDLEAEFLRLMDI